MKKTPWYPGTVKPVRICYYECDLQKFSIGIQRDYWDGKQWCHSHLGGAYPSTTQNSYKWRGLAREGK